jgi:hypothetical protein
MAKREPGGFDGTATVYRGNLYLHIDENGRVEYDIVRAERSDAPTLVMACLLMCIKLTKLIDEEGVL